MARPERGNSLSRIAAVLPGARPLRSPVPRARGALSLCYLPLFFFFWPFLLFALLFFFSFFFFFFLFAFCLAFSTPALFRGTASWSFVAGASSWRFLASASSWRFLASASSWRFLASASSCRFLASASASSCPFPSSFVNVSVAGLNSSALDRTPLLSLRRPRSGPARRAASPRPRHSRASVSDCPAPVSLVKVSVAGLNSSALDRASVGCHSPPAIRTCPEGSVAATAPARASVSDCRRP